MDKAHATLMLIATVAAIAIVAILASAYVLTHGGTTAQAFGQDGGEEGDERVAGGIVDFPIGYFARALTVGIVPSVPAAGPALRIRLLRIQPGARLWRLLAMPNMIGWRFRPLCGRHLTARLALVILQATALERIPILPHEFNSGGRIRHHRIRRRIGERGQDRQAIAEMQPTIAQCPSLCISPSNRCRWNMSRTLVKPSNAPTTIITAVRVSIVSHPGGVGTPTSVSTP